MDSATFDRFTRRFASATSRRRLGHVLLMLGVGAVLDDEAEAKQRRRNPDRDDGTNGKRRSKRKPDRDRLSATVAPVEIDYFALGDSIASGHGLNDEGNVDGRGEWCEPKTGEPPCCRRSKQAYPYRLKQLLANDGMSIVRFEHKACSGAKVPNLKQQIAEVLTQLDGSRRPTLVTISIGGNDTGLTSFTGLVEVLYVMADFQFENLLNSFEKTAEDLRLEIERLLVLPDVVVALNELYNPFNEKSVLFGVRCVTHHCWDRSNRIIETINRLWQEQVVKALNDRYSGRIVMTNGLAGEFANHWGAPAEDVTKLVCTKKGGRKKCQEVKVGTRQECGFAPIPRRGREFTDDGKTWILSRTGTRFNSFPFKGPRVQTAWSVWQGYLSQTALGRDPLAWKGDCAHPNELGQIAIAEHLLQSIKDLGPFPCGDATFCAGGCVDTSSSSSHCGRCGNACPSDKSCDNGDCRASSPYQFVTQFGQTGDDDQEFNAPRGIAVDPSGLVYVGDQFNRRIQVLRWDRGSEQLNFVASYLGEAPLDFFPYDVAIDEVGTVFVTNPGPGHAGIHALRWNEELERLETIATAGRTGATPGSTIFPLGIAIGRGGLIVVTDFITRQIHALQFDQAERQFRFLTSFGSKGSGPDQFHTPQGVAFDSSGTTVFVADGLENARIQVLRWISEHEKFAPLTRFGSPGSNPGQFSGLWGLASDRGGIVYATDPGRVQVLRWDADDLTFEYVSAFGTRGTGQGQFAGCCMGIAVGPEGTILVADGIGDDAAADRIQVFRKPATSALREIAADTNLAKAGDRKSDRVGKRRH